MPSDRIVQGDLQGEVHHPHKLLMRKPRFIPPRPRPIHPRFRLLGLRVQVPPALPAALQSFHGLLFQRVKAELLVCFRRPLPLLACSDLSPPELPAHPMLAQSYGRHCQLQPPGHSTPKKRLSAGPATQLGILTCTTLCKYILDLSMRLTASCLPEAQSSRPFQDLGSLSGT